MALMLEDKRAAITKELHKAIHPRSTEPDHVTLNYAFMLMKKAVTKLADLRAQLAEAESKLKYLRKCTQVNWDKMEAAEGERDALREMILDAFDRDEEHLAEKLAPYLAAAPAEEGGRVTIADRDVAKADRERGMAAPEDEG